MTEHEPERDDGPLELDLIQAAYATYVRSRQPRNADEPDVDDGGQAASFLLDAALPQLLHEVHGWRMYTAEGDDYAVGFAPGQRFVLPALQASRLAESQGGQLWIRERRAGPWRPLEEPPF